MFSTIFYVIILSTVLLFATVYTNTNPNVSVFGESLSEEEKPLLVEKSGKTQLAPTINEDNFGELDGCILGFAGPPATPEECIECTVGKDINCEPKSNMPWTTANKLPGKQIDNELVKFQQKKLSKIILGMEKADLVKTCEKVSKLNPSTLKVEMCENISGEQLSDEVDGVLAQAVDDGYRLEMGNILMWSKDSLMQTCVDVLGYEYIDECADFHGIEPYGGDNDQDSPQ